MDDRLKELKKLYKEMSKPLPDPYAKEIEQRLAEREEDLMAPHTCNAAYIYHPMGAEIDEIEPFTNDLIAVVDKMKEKLMLEKRILEGTDVPEYKENELSPTKLTEEQWKNASQSGSLITDPIHISTHGSNSSSPFAELLNLQQVTAALSAKYGAQQLGSCQGMLDDCGCETGAMNECCDCMEQTINVPTDGMQNEVK